MIVALALALTLATIYRLFELLQSPLIHSPTSRIPDSARLINLITISLLLPYQSFNRIPSTQAGQNGFAHVSRTGNECTQVYHQNRSFGPNALGNSPPAHREISPPPSRSSTIIACSHSWPVSRGRSTLPPRSFTPCRFGHALIKS